MKNQRFVLPVLLLFAICFFCTLSIAADTSSTTAQSGSCININTAPVDQLQDLPGIGPEIAQRIVEFRKTVGPFKTVEDIMKVKGIGEKRFEKIKAQICSI